MVKKSSSLTNSEIHSGIQECSGEMTIQFLKNVIMNAKLLMAFLDLNGNVLIWNLAAEEFTGYPSEEVLGRNNIWKYIYPDPAYRKDVTKQIEDIIGNKKYLRNFETTIRTKSGNTRTISWNTRELYDKEGLKTGYIVLGNDITEIRQNEGRYLAFISEAAMRLKTPAEMIKQNILNAINDFEKEETDREELILILKLQVKNLEQIQENLRYLNEKIVEGIPHITQESKQFLTR